MGYTNHMRRRVIEIALVVVAVALTMFYVNARKASEGLLEEPGVEVTPVAQVMESPTPDSQILDDLTNAGCSVPEPPDFHNPPPFSEAMQLRGKGLYQTYCASCHGQGGQGDGRAGQVLNPKPTDLTEQRAYRQGSRPEVVAFTVYHGIEGTGMAPWGDILTEEEIWAIGAYVELSLLKKRPVSRRQVRTGFRVRRITASVLADNVTDDDKAAIAGFVCRTSETLSPSPSPTPRGK